MALSLEEIRHLAELARIELSSEEQERFREQIEAILGYVDRLAAIDTSSIVLGSGDTDAVLAADVVTPASAETRKTIIEAFPDHLGDLMRVPAVFDKPKS